MIEQFDANRLSEKGDPAGQLDVVGAGFGRPRRMIMGKDDPVRSDIERSRQQAPDIAFDMGRTALGDDFVGDIAPVVRHERGMKPLGRRVAEVEAKIVQESRVSRRNARAPDLLVEAREDEPPGSDNRYG